MNELRTIEANPRSSRGKNEARRLRRQGFIPATLYGGKKDPVAISVEAKRLAAILRAGHNTIFNVTIDGDTDSVLIKDWQTDPLKGRLLHADLIRIRLDQETRVEVPIRIVGEPRGVKQDGGLLDVVSHELEVECLPTDIPEYIDVDVSDLAVGDHISVKDVKIDPKIKILTDPDHVIASVLAPRLAEVEAPAAAAPEVPAEPEVIKKGKTEEEKQ